MVVFYHIPKTAGTSILASAREVFVGPVRRVKLPGMKQWLDNIRVNPYSIGYPAFLSGHFGYGVHEMLPEPSFTFTFLREPCHQALSMAVEAAKRPDIYPQGNLSELLRRDTGAPYFGNPQVRHLSSRDGSPILGPLTNEHLDRAKDILTNRLTCFGITEYFQASLTLINSRMGTRLRFQTSNRSLHTATSELSADAVSLLCEANALDVELYGYSRRLFLDRLSTHLKSQEKPQTYEVGGSNVQAALSGLE